MCMFVAEYLGRVTNRYIQANWCCKIHQLKPEKSENRPWKTPLLQARGSEVGAMPNHNTYPNRLFPLMQYVNPYCPGSATKHSYILYIHSSTAAALGLGVGRGPLSDGTGKSPPPATLRIRNLSLRAR